MESSVYPKKKKKYCCVMDCKNSDLIANLAFFELPKEDDRRKEWLIKINREDLLNKENLKRRSYAVCSIHFDDSDMKIVKHLKGYAVPTKYLNGLEQETVPCKDPISSEMSTKDRFEYQDQQLISNNASLSIIKTEHDYYNDQCIESILELEIKKEPGSSDSESIESAESPNHVSEEYPSSMRKRKLSEDLMGSQNKCPKLEEALEEKKDLETDISAIVDKDPSYKIDERLYKLITWVNKLKDDTMENQFNPEYKRFLLNLHYYSPHAYRCLKTALKLPKKSILNQFKMTISPKLENQIFETLEMRVNSLPNNEKYCTISVDQVALERNLYYDTKADQVVGFESINDKTSSLIATNAYVVIAQGICSNWSQPIAYAFLASTNRFEELDLWLTEIILKLKGVGVTVKAISSNEDSNFDRFAKEVKKVTVERPYIMFNDTKVYYIFDVPHLVKGIRNSLLTNDFYYGGKLISWDYVKQVHNDQKKRKSRLTPKITDCHVDPNDVEKQCVKYAVEIFSETVSSALHTYVDLGTISEEARPTAEFMEMINNLFDVLNSDKTKCNNKFKIAFKKSYDQIQVLEDAQEFFSTAVKIKNEWSNNAAAFMKTFENMLITIQSIIMLYDDLKAEGSRYLLTRRLNQENLVKFLSAIRQHAGSPPTAIKFKKAFSAVFVSYMTSSSEGGNVGVDFCDVLRKAEHVVKFTSKQDPCPKVSGLKLSSEVLQDFKINLSVSKV